jgi:hypothetical protein
MQKTLLTSALALALAPMAVAQSTTGCDLYYKFDRGVGNKAVNYGTASVDSTITTSGTGATTWATGKHGKGLAGTASTTAATNWVDTGWNSTVTSSFSVSWWCKEQSAPGTLSYLFSGKGSFRCFTSGVAGKELWVRAWGGVDITLPTSGADFQTRAKAAKGVNVAVVVNKATNKVQWYIDGVAHGPAQTITAAVAIPAGNFRIGKHSSDTFSWCYHTDEFRFCSRAATAAEVKAWHTAPAPGWGTLGKDCGIKHTANGLPKAGYPLYRLDFSGPASFRYLFVAGAVPNAGFDMGVVFPSLKGCNWYAQFQIEIMGATRNGKVQFLVPIPANAAGFGLETQMLGIDGSNKMIQSNALSTKVEK